MPKTDKKQEEIVVVNKINDQMISEHNDLIKSFSNMKLVPQKLFEIAVSAVDPRNKQTSRTVKISKKQIYKSLGISSHNGNRLLTTALKQLLKDAIFEGTFVNEDGEYTDIGINPIAKIKNKRNSEYCEITFTEEIMPLITDLKQNFTRLQLDDLLKLEDKYGISLYKWLSMHYRQYQAYLKSGSRSKVMLDKYANPEISLKNLRKLTGTQEKYRDFRNFKRQVLKAAVDDINSHSPFQVSFEQIYQGRKTIAIKFHVSKQESQPVQNDPASGQNSPKQDNYSDAVKKKYTQMLIVANIIEPLQIMDKKLMLGLSQNVYPAYDDFVIRHSEDELKKHLNYLGGHMEQNIDNLIGYLGASLSSYEPQKPKKRRSIRKKEKMPEWASERKIEKASPQEIAKLRERIKNRNYRRKES